MLAQSGDVLLRTPRHRAWTVLDPRLRYPQSNYSDFKSIRLQVAKPLPSQEHRLGAQSTSQRIRHSRKETAEAALRSIGSFIIALRLHVRRLPSLEVQVRPLIQPPCRLRNSGRRLCATSAGLLMRSLPFSTPLLSVPAALLRWLLCRRSDDFSETLTRNLFLCHTQSPRVLE